MLGESPRSSWLELSTVPDDVILILFSLLDITDLLRCKQVCSRFHRLVETDTSLQYKIELVKSGMVDGPTGPGTLGTGDRLDNLRAYSARLRRGQYVSVQDRSIDSDPDRDEPWERVWSTGASIAYVVLKAGRRELALSVPPVSTSEAVRKGRNVVVPLDEFGRGVLVATDYTQGLLVGVSKHIGDCSDFHIRIGSLKTGRLGHRLAREAVLPTSAFDRYVDHAPADVLALRIYSQYVLLVTFVDRVGPYEFQVSDWMTGTSLVKTIIATAGTPRFTLIDSAHFAVIGSRDSQISVYRFGSDVDQLVSETPLFRLALPGAGVRPAPHMQTVFFFVRDISISLPLPPSGDNPDIPATFAMDPDSAVLVIDFTMMTGVANGNYLVLVPSSPLRAAMRKTYRSLQSNQPLDWGEWGSGALLLHKHDLGSDGSWIYPVAHGRPYGSRMPVLVYPKGNDTTLSQILIIEMDPRASGCVRTVENVEPEGKEPSKGATALLREHIRLDVHGYRLRPKYAVYRGPLMCLPQGVGLDEVVLDEHGVSVLFGGPGDRNTDVICGFQTWALG
ncbi:hypothetical protein V8D89_003242 [Ganoderma adspersum]